MSRIATRENKVWAYATTYRSGAGHYITPCAIRLRVSVGPPQPAVSQLALLRLAKDIYDLAPLLGYKPKTIAFILYKISDQDKFTSFQIPKHTGGFRQINAPVPRLKALQRRLSLLLQNCIGELEVERKSWDDCSHGFRRARSTSTNAAVHVKQRWVLNLDIKDFFQSIYFGRVYGYFQKDKGFQLNPKVATILAQIACFHSGLPQGSPSSPVVSNCIASILDRRLVSLAIKFGCRYSRYVDDLTLSTNKTAFPSALAFEGLQHEWQVGAVLDDAIARTGFSVNSAKTRMQYRSARQDVTGLVVNRKPNIPAPYRRLTRAMVHRLVRTGKSTIDAFDGTTSQMQTLNSLHGRLAYIDRIDLMNAMRNPRKNVSQDDLEAKERPFANFLIYSRFYAAARPVIMFEGPTDAIYLLHAIRQLSANYSQLAAVDGTGSITLRVNLFRPTGKRTGQLLRLRGGSGDIFNWLKRYPATVSKFKAPGLLQPVIAIVDNDAGSTKIWNFLKNKTGVESPKDAFHIHVAANLFVVPIPLLGGQQQAAIESCFSQQTLNVKVGGKSLNLSKDGIDEKTQYGKRYFAQHVIAQNADKIDFSGFAPLLDRINGVIAVYKPTASQPTQETI